MRLAAPLDKQALIRRIKDLKVLNKQGLKREVPLSKKGRGFVMTDHTYIDFSPLTTAELLKLAHEEDDDKDKKTLKIKIKKKKESCLVSFPMRLHQMLEDPALNDVICWMPHGRSWIIKDKKKLEGHLMEYFNHHSLPSFNRQVNGWGFKRLKRAGPDYNGYYHEMFLRGRPALASFMNRTYKAGRRIADPLNEPDFDSISKQYPLLPEAPEELWEPIPVASFEDLDTSFKSWVGMNLNEIESVSEALEEFCEPTSETSFEDLDTSFKSWVSMNLNEIEKDLTYASLASELGIYTIG